jgi:hypothetical protein
MKEIERPAIVRQNVDIEALRKEAEGKHADVMKSDTESATRKKEAGDILLVLKKTVGKNWKAWLKANVAIHYRTVAPVHADREELAGHRAEPGKAHA